MVHFKISGNLNIKFWEINLISLKNKVGNLSSEKADISVKGGEKSCQ